MPKGVFVRRVRPIHERFWPKVDRTGTCWIWTGACDKDGYGQFKVTISPGVYRQEKAHRVALEIALGRPLRPGMQSLHTCDNPPCVRPLHLFEGTTGDNRRDTANKGHIPRPTWLHRKGVDHPRAKLTEAQVLNIRARYVSGEAQASIGASYGLDQAYISQITRRKLWKHI